VRWLEAGKPPACGTERGHADRDRGTQCRGGNRKAKCRAPQSFGSQGSPSPCQVWGDAVHWSPPTSLQALLFLGVLVPLAATSPPPENLLRGSR